MPITAGGKIKSLSDIYNFLRSGADKVVVNSKIVDDKNFLNKSSREFGSQCIVASIDVKKIDNKFIVFTNNGSTETTLELKDHIKYCEDEGAGEVFLNSIDRDGSGKGYDINLFEIASKLVTIPIIACGGAGSYDHITDLAKKTDIDGISAANFFQHVDQSLYFSKKKLYDKNENFRKPEILKL
jgi:cyclase